MAKQKFVVDGVIEAVPGASSPLLNNERADVPSELLFAVDLVAGARGAIASTLQTPSLDDSDLVEIALDGGGHLWMSVGELRESLLLDVTVSRAGGVARIPPRLAIDAQQRGIGDWAIRALRFFRIDPLGELAGAAQATLVERIEATLQTEPGLYRLDDAADLPTFHPVKAGATFDEQPYLLFLHGTNSSTQGSFGDLWSHDGGSAIRALRSRYGAGHLLALQHRSLSESPVANALQVAKAIPAGVRLDLLTHSRGGLVGELLARATVAADQLPFTALEVEHYRAGTSVAEARRLQQLGDLLAQRRYPIERFVRVACPARGTTLASGKIERYCNVLLNLVDARLVVDVSGVAGSLFALLKAVIKKLVDFEDLPGLAAMNPASALVKLLNGEQRTVDADLTVIAGDTEGGTWIKRVGMLLVDAFFDRDNDLVVDTISMRGGAMRTRQAYQHLQRSADVSHLDYFRHPIALERILRALCERDSLRRRAGFDLVDVEQGAMATRGLVPLRAVTRSADPTPPIVYVLPGIMGTHLKVKDDRIWLSYPRLVFGAFGKLKLSSRHVEPDGLDGDTYGDLVDFLSASHEVMPFGYDWRLPVEDAARKLNVALLGKLATIDRERQPIRIVAHSMGGLVARAMMLLDDSAWPRLCAHADARLLMLGTPNAGSHAITQLLFGEEKLVRLLATFDLRHGLDDIIGQIAEFPGALDMLPASSVRSYFDAEVWRELTGAAMPSKWPTPTGAALNRAKAWRDQLGRQTLDPQRVFYVAGQADDTPEEIELETRGERQHIRFRITPAGDGRVPWDGGIPANLDAWFTAARHGDLAAHAPAHAGYLDILEHGETSVTALRRERPTVVARSRARDVDGRTIVVDALPPVTEVASLPTADEIARAAAGRGAADRRPLLHQAPLPIRVGWGDLRCARHAVMVGHYAGDSITSAEAAIDRALGGRLGEMHRLAIYPGAPDSTLAIIDTGTQPPGVVVIGLGGIGKLTPGSLGDAVARGVVEWIGAREEARRRAPGDAAPDVGGISLLLIGAGEGGVDADTAVYSILRGVREGIERGRRAGIASTLAEIEFVELYQDRAHRLWHALDRLLGEDDLRQRFVLKGQIVALGDGQQRLWEAAPAGWWRRLQIRLPAVADGQLRELEFTSLTDSARSEAYRLPFEAKIIATLIDASIATTTRDAPRDETLFELLLPNAIKERAPQRESLVLLLDRDSANMPWELLTDPLDRDLGDIDQRTPLAIRAGLVRQFATADFRARPTVVVENTALVIGDPLTPPASFAELKGAQHEARTVANLLQGNARFTVEHLHRPDGATVVQALLPHRYRILHVAGHGMLGNADLDRDSGIVLDTFNLTWASLEQMRAIPELVFINCCHLGRVAAGENDTSLSLRNVFAAGVGETFIHNGARAVIAAGWAVEDAGAETFATTFYTRMLAGDSFGLAVRRARAAVYRVAPLSNTWGAYQCYGDPDYRLVNQGSAGSGVRPAPRYASTEELITDTIDTIARGDLDAPSRERVRQQIEQLGATARALDPLQEARVQIALARASTRANLHAEAIAGYLRALDLDPAAPTLGDLAEHANEYLLHALAQRRTDDASTAERKRVVDATLGEGIQRLEQLLSIAPSRQRHWVLARAYRYAALIRGGAARQKALQAAFDQLKAANEDFPLDPTSYSDSRQMALLELLLAWRRGKPSATAFKRVRKALERIAATSTTLVDAARTDVTELLLEALITGKPDASLRASIVAAQLAIASNAFDEPDDPVGFVVAMLADAKPAPARALGRELAAPPVRAAVKRKGRATR